VIRAQLETLAVSFIGAVFFREILAMEVFLVTNTIPTGRGQSEVTTLSSLWRYTNRFLLLLLLLAMSPFDKQIKVT